jgi:hypothetical protein
VALDFSGTRVAVIGSALPHGGRIVVVVDRRAQIVSVRSAHPGVRRILFRSRALRHGRHRLRVTVLRGPVELDAFAIEP